MHGAVHEILLLVEHLGAYLCPCRARELAAGERYTAAAVVYTAILHSRELLLEGPGPYVTTNGLFSTILQGQNHEI